MRVVLLFLVCVGRAPAQLTIGSVVNAGSRIQSGSSFGIAQGSLFAINGKGVGPDQFQQATFPLPTTGGLGGVTVQASVGGATVDCILVYVAPNEVGAILPSGTPLGTGTVTVNNSGVTASKPITVVAAAFGIFTQNYGFGSGLALAFNVASDGSTTANSLTQNVQPGQDVLINGTGLGAIPSDETQSGVTDVPATTIQVYVGIKPATVVSAGRGACCDGLDPNYRVPPGIAAWDVIRITIPDGINGCFVPVAVQIGSTVSNLATIAIGSGGAACVPPLPPPDLTQQFAGKTGISIGSINLARTIGFSATAAGAISSNKRDTGSAVFVKYDSIPAGDQIAANIIYPENVCSINGFPGPNGVNTVNGAPVTIIPLKSVGVDAGAALTVKGPSGTRTILRQMAGMLVGYQTSANFGDTTPGNYFDAGHYVVTGPGGKDVGVFTASTDVPSKPFVWTNMPSVTAGIDRSKDLTINWTGGIPDTQVTVVGTSDGGGANVSFLCAAPVSAGQLTIPAYVLLSLPASGAQLFIGGLGVQTRSVTTFTAPGLDLATLAYSEGYSLNLRYQ